MFLPIQWNSSHKAFYSQHSCRQGSKPFYRKISFVKNSNTSFNIFKSIKFQQHIGNYYANKLNGISTRNLRFWWCMQTIQSDPRDGSLQDTLFNTSLLSSSPLPEKMGKAAHSFWQCQHHEHFLLHLSYLLSSTGLCSCLCLRVEQSFGTPVVVAFQARPFLIY